MSFEVLNFFLQTTIEFYSNWVDITENLWRCRHFRNAYDKGWRKNLTRVFGDHYQCPWYLSVLAIWINMPKPDYPFDLAEYLHGPKDDDVVEMKSDDEENGHNGDENDVEKQKVSSPLRPQQQQSSRQQQSRSMLV